MPFNAFYCIRTFGYSCAPKATCPKGNHACELLKSVGADAAALESLAQECLDRRKKRSFTGNKRERTWPRNP